MMIESFPLFSGSSGNSVYLRCGRDEFLIDGGVSCRRLTQALASVGSAPGRLRAVFVTHEHIDHVRGLEMLCKNYDIPVYMNSFSAEELARLGGCEHLLDHVTITDAKTTVYLEECAVTSFRTPHDACGSVGYRVETEDDVFAYATDIGYVTREIASRLFGARRVVLESNHDVTMLKNGPYPASLKARILSDRGHLSNEACARFVPYLAENGAEHIILAHLSKENNTPAKAYEESLAALREAGREDVHLSVAPRDITNITAEESLYR